VTAAMAGDRLNRHLARRGVASRRGADELIAAGRVRINGAPAMLGSIVSERDIVSVDGRTLQPRLELLTLALNKPLGVVTTRRDPQGRRTVMDLVPPVPGLVPVGRLDADSRGLLVLTTDGELAHRLAHPRYGLRRVYRVRVVPAASDRQRDALLAGVALDDGPARALEARRLHGGTVLELVMGEGRRREVRRMCAAVGLDVIDLCRVACGPLRLGDLPEGSARQLTADELAALRRAAGLRPDGV
jgi:23S rRNA pseudouridine2605 synthase